jgi:stress-induced morphogen
MMAGYGQTNEGWQSQLGACARLVDMWRMSSRATRLRDVLTREFAPAVVQVLDDSAHHAGHAGAQPGGETHYSVLMVAEAFSGLSRVSRSRAVHAVLAAEFSSGLHALALTLRTPEEHAAFANRSS